MENEGSREDDKNKTLDRRKKRCKRSGTDGPGLRNEVAMEGKGLSI